MKKQVKRAINYLQTSYNNGIIDYPRIDNSFITRKSFDLFPHPKFPQFGEKMKPLDFNNYRVNKKNSLLLLSVTRILTPSNIEPVYDLIDEVFDDELNIKAQKQQYFQDIMREKEVFFRDNGISNSDISNMHQSIYKEVQDEDILLVKIEDFFACSKSSPLLASLQKQEHRQRKKETNTKTDTKEEKHGEVYRSEASSLAEALEKWIEFSKREAGQQIENSDDAEKFLGMKQ